MNMTDSEIIRDYKAASNKVKQIGILADMNECKKGRIIEILLAHGVEIPGNFKKPIETPEAAVKEALQLETVTVGRGPAEAPKIVTTVDKKAIALEDVLDMIFNAVDDFAERQDDDRPGAAAALVGYLYGVKDAYNALCGPIVR